MENKQATTEARQSIQDLISQTREFLKVVINKSGIRTDVEALSSTVNFVLDASHARSVFLGDYVAPSETKPVGEIYLYLDAIIDYSLYLGVDYGSLIAKVLLTQLHHALSYKPDRTLDYIKAENFASKACRKLNRQGIISDVRPKMYFDPSATNPVELTARQKWMDKWLAADEVVTPESEEGATAP
jgi:hypothetical protein